jgi:hypothetical protein
LFTSTVLLTVLLIGGSPQPPPDPDDFESSFIAWMRFNHGAPVRPSCRVDESVPSGITCSATVDGLVLSASPVIVDGEPEDWVLGGLDAILDQMEQDSAEQFAEQNAERRSEAEGYDTAIADAVVACEDWESAGDFQLFDDGHTVAFESEVDLTDDSNLECISEELEIPTQVLLEMEMLNEPEPVSHGPYTIVRSVPEPREPALMLIYDDEVDD